MQLRECKNIEMKRDMDLVRDLLLHVESDPLLDGTHWLHADTPSELGITGHSADEVGYHVNLLGEAGFLRIMGMETIPAISKLTWEGHEFLDNIRDQGIWSKTKERIKGLPSVAIAVVAEIAKAEIKAKLGLP